MITKVANGQVASITLKTRRAVNKNVVLSAPDFSNLNTRSEFILLTNDGTNGKVVVLENSNITLANYSGNGVFQNSIVRGIVDLPKLPFLPISWQFCTHINLNNIDYICVFAWPLARNDYWNGKVVVCLISCSTLVVTDLDLNINSYTVAIGQLTDAGNNGVPTYYTTNFITKEVVYNRGPDIAKFNFNTRQQTFPFNFSRIGTLDQSGALSAYFNPIDNYYVGYYGQFKEGRGEVYWSRTSKGSYDYIRNAKIGTINYWGRLNYINANGETIGGLENTSQGGPARIHTPKNNTIFMADTNAYIAFIDQLNGSNFLLTAITDKIHSSTIDADYLNKDGLSFCLIGNSVRVHFAFITKSPSAINQAYYDLPSSPLAICNDKIKISL